MPRTAVANIGRSELRLLQYVQQHGPVTVRQVADHFAATEGVGRTTVLNVMVRLWQKQYLKRRRGPRGAHVYLAREERPRLLRRLVRDFVGDVLGGSVSPFLAYLTDNAEDLTAEDRRELARLLRQLPSREEP